MSQLSSNNRCNACGNKTSRLRRHALRVHMPWYMDPSTACVDCQRNEGTGLDLNRFHPGHQRVVGETLLQAWVLLMNGIFLFMTKNLGLGSPNDLLGFVVANELHPRSFRFSEEEIFFFREFDRRSGLEPLTADEYKSIPPTRLIVLSNYSVVLKMWTHLSPIAQSKFLAECRYVRLDGSFPPNGHPKLKVGIIDSHFHLDGFFDRYPTTLSALERSAKSEIDVHLCYAIQNFVFPARWPNIDRHMAGDPRLRFTLGIHPHVLAKGRPLDEFKKLQDMLENYPEAVGIGEIGIDHTTRCKCATFHNTTRCREEKLETQRQFLRLVLPLAKELGKVIVLHVRSKDKDEQATAAQETLKELLDAGLSNAPIHRHCFVGGIEEYNDWSSKLPNCYFSLSSKSVKDSKTVACLKSVGRPDRLILETDSPYLVNTERPWMAYKNGEKAAQIMGIPTIELIRVCNRNAARLYNLPW